MNGLIKSSKLDGVNLLGSLSIALFAVIGAVYVMASGLGGIA